MHITACKKREFAIFFLHDEQFAFDTFLYCNCTLSYGTKPKHTSLRLNSTTQSDSLSYARNSVNTCKASRNEKCSEKVPRTFLGVPFRYCFYFIFRSEKLKENTRMQRYTFVHSENKLVALVSSCFLSLSHVLSLSIIKVTLKRRARAMFDMSTVAISHRTHVPPVNIPIPPALSVWFLQCLTFQDVHLSAVHTALRLILQIPCNVLESKVV